MFLGALFAKGISLSINDHRFDPQGQALPDTDLLPDAACRRALLLETPRLFPAACEIWCRIVVHCVPSSCKFLACFLPR